MAILRRHTRLWEDVLERINVNEKQDFVEQASKAHVKTSLVRVFLQDDLRRKAPTLPENRFNIVGCVRALEENATQP